MCKNIFPMVLHFILFFVHFPCWTKLKRFSGTCVYLIASSSEGSAHKPKVVPEHSVLCHTSADMCTTSLLSLARCCVCYLAICHSDGEGLKLIGWNSPHTGAKCRENGAVQFPENNRYQIRNLVANWGKTVILLIDYACMNYTLTHQPKLGALKNT